MSMKTLNRAVVVLAQDHNPTILHPAFLEAQSIVPKEWQLAEPPICTPALSVVKYANGVVLLVESNRLQVLENAPSEDAADSSVPDVAAKYVMTLPHVRYTAVGINSTVLAECGNPETAIIDRFLKSGPWNGGALQLKAAGLKFVYSAGGCLLRMSLDPGNTVIAGGEPLQGVIANANYQFDVHPGSPVADVERAIRAFPERCSHLAGVMRTVLGLEG
jgi:hypothetical protein